MLEIGDLYAGEKRKLLLKLQVPAMAALGLAQVAELELDYVELPELVGQVGDCCRSRSTSCRGTRLPAGCPTRSSAREVLFQEAQDDKKAASEALERGDRETATASGSTRPGAS